MSLPEPSTKPSTQPLAGHRGPKPPLSERRIQANRRNALRSTGPRTARGKRTVARNALKHGLLAREAVITAGDGEEDTREFHALVEKLHQCYQPVGVIEEMLVQTIATCWWRKARVIRAENGEIRKQLDTLHVDRRLRDSDRANLILAVDQIGLGFFGRENPADRVPLIEVWTALQRAQTTLRSHHSGLSYLCALLEKAKAEMASDGYMSEETRRDIVCEFTFWDCLFALQCSHAVPPQNLSEDPPGEAVEDKEAEKEFAALVTSAIDHQLKKIKIFEEYSVQREQLTGDAEARSFSLPPAEATDKLLRYEAHLDRQLYRAMDQLERLQRQRRGETVPPPLSINLSRRS
ncbi:MAG TPA: hypothetical protein VEH30_01865 [Terriglobales bacterium]|nr:hypothetical protein [Terriglobales bacterium]